VKLCVKLEDALREGLKDTKKSSNIRKSCGDLTNKQDTEAWERWSRSLCYNQFPCREVGYKRRPLKVQWAKVSFSQLLLIFDVLLRHFLMAQFSVGVAHFAHILRRPKMLTGSET